MVAKPVGLLLQVPPVVGNTDNTSVYVAQTTGEPVIGAGDGLTVTVSFTKQPVPNVYVIYDVPAAAPYTTPLVGSMVATEDGAAVHVPVVGVLLSAVVSPTHTLSVPVIGDGRSLTVTA